MKLRSTIEEDAAGRRDAALSIVNNACLPLGKQTQLPIRRHGIVGGLQAGLTLAGSAIAVSCVLGNLHPLIRP
jgi:hypothetical protein